MAQGWSAYLACAGPGFLPSSANKKKKNNKQINKMLATNAFLRWKLTWRASSGFGSEKVLEKVLAAEAGAAQGGEMEARRRAPGTGTRLASGSGWQCCSLRCSSGLAVPKGHRLGGLPFAECAHHPSEMGLCPRRGLCLRRVALDNELNSPEPQVLIGRVGHPCTPLLCGREGQMTQRLQRPGVWYSVVTLSYGS